MKQREQKSTMKSVSSVQTRQVHQLVTWFLLSGGNIGNIIKSQHRKNYQINFTNIKFYHREYIKESYRQIYCVKYEVFV